MPIISDIVYMTEQAYMVIAGAALVKGGEVAEDHLPVHRRSRRARAPVALRRPPRPRRRRPPRAGFARRWRACRERGRDYYRYGADPAPPRFPAEELDGLFPPDHRVAYDARQVLARITDHSLFWEILPETGREMICGIGRVGGLYAGFVANNPMLTEHPVHGGVRRPGGILYREGIAKISQFSRACNDDGIPLVWLQDISGFDIGIEAEKQGLLGYGSSLIYTNATNSVPMFTVLLRKASGAGYYAMAGLPYQPVLQLATPMTRLAVMEGRTLAIGAYHTQARRRVPRGGQDRGGGRGGPARHAGGGGADRARHGPGARRLADGRGRGGGARRAADLARGVDRDGLPGHRLPAGKEPPHLVAARPGDAPSWMSPCCGCSSTTGACSLPRWDSGAAIPPARALLSPGAFVGSLTQGNRRRVLALPVGSSGRLVTSLPRDRVVPVAYGTLLFELAPLTSEELQPAEAADRSRHPGGSDLPAGTRAVVAPTDGVFYRRTAPGAPAFIEPGQTVHAGQAIGLVEVMKTFNQVLYGGPELPDTATVAEVRAQDGEEIRAGQVLLLVREA